MSASPYACPGCSIIASGTCIPRGGRTWHAGCWAKNLEQALIEIRDSDPVENALDPQWAARIAKETLND